MTTPQDETDRPTPSARDGYGLSMYRLSTAERDAVRAQLIAEAEEMSLRFPELQAELIDLLQSVNPAHLMAIVGHYGLSSPVSSVDGISDNMLTGGIGQHHVELIQAFALHLPRHRWGRSAASHYDVQKIIDLLPPLADAFQKRRYLAGAEVKTDFERYRLMLIESLRLHTQMVRNWGHEQQVLDISRRLYAPLDASFRKMLDFSLTGFINVARAMVDFHEERVNEHFGKLKRFRAEKTVEGTARRYHALFAPDEDPELFLAQAQDWSLDQVRYCLMGHAGTLLDETARYTVAALAEATGLPSAEVERILDALSLTPGALADTNIEHIFLANPIWDRPLVKLDGSYFSAIPQVIFSFIHPIIRQFAADPLLADALEKRRARFLEEEAAAIIGRALPDAELRTGNKWKVGTQSFETDVVAKFDTALLIIEAKSSVLTEPGLRGAPARVKRHIKELIVEPARQSMRLEELIAQAKAGDEAARQIVAPLDLDILDVEHIMRISVTLEDFSIVAAAESAMRSANWLPGDLQLGSTIGLADLEAVADILDEPERFVHYLQGRQRLPKALNINGDEMDFLGFYLQSSFNIAAIEAEKPNLSISGKSAGIDRWFASRMRGYPMTKPAPEVHPYFAKLLANLRRQGRPGWLSVALDILRAFDPAEQEEVVFELEKLRDRTLTAKCERDRTASMLATAPHREAAIHFHIFPPEQYADRREWGQRLGAMGLEESGCSRCVMIGRQVDRWEESYAYIGMVYE